MEVGQAVQDAFRDLAQDLFSCSAPELLDFFIDAVQTTTLTELHRN